MKSKTSIRQREHLKAGIQTLGNQASSRVLLDASRTTPAPALLGRHLGAAQTSATKQGKTLSEWRRSGRRTDAIGYCDCRVLRFDFRQIPNNLIENP